MTSLAPVDGAVVHRDFLSARSRLVGVLPESEGELELVAIKMPSKLKARIDAAAKLSGNNRTQTMLALIRHSLEQLERELQMTEPKPEERPSAQVKKSKGR